MKSKTWLFVLFFFYSGMSTTAAVEKAGHLRGAEVVVYSAEEKWRRGTEDDDIVFGVVSDIAISDDGRRLFVLDQQLKKLFVLDIKGELTGSRSLFGEGPGEVTQPNSIFARPDGGVGLIQQFPPKIVALDSCLIPVSFREYSINPPTGFGQFFFHGSHSAGEIIVVGATFIKTDRDIGCQTRMPSFVVLGRRSRDALIVPCETYQISMQKPVFREVMLDIPLKRWALSAHGNIFVAPTLDEYSISVYDTMGAVVENIRKEAPVDYRDGDELEALEAMLRGSFGNMPKDMKFELNPIRPPIEEFLNGVTRRGAEEMWVRTTAGSDQTDLGPTFDVYNNAGEWLYGARLEGVGGAKHDMYFFWGDRYLIRVLNVMGSFASSRGVRGLPGEVDEAMQIVLYKLN